MTFFNYQLSLWQWGILAFCAIGVGISKTGITGVASIVVAAIVFVFPARESTGIILPMLCFSDVLAVIWYKRNAAWKYIAILLPWAVVGFGIALIFDRFVSISASVDAIFKVTIGLCILAGLVVMMWQDAQTKKAFSPPSKKLGVLFGILGGFTAMIGNTAGPIMSIYLLSTRLPKKDFLGTAAWFFLIINYLKLPLQFFIWKNIKPEGLVLNLAMVPFIILGMAAGILMVKKISERHYRIAVYVMTVVSIGLLFWQVFI